MRPLSETLASLAQHLSAAGVPEAGLDDARAIAQTLPAALTQCFYIERWLHDPAPRADLIVQVAPEQRALFTALAGERARDQPDWARLARFAQAWSRPGGPLEAWLTRVWLEFDLLPGAAVAGVVPRLFVDFSRERLGGLAPAQALDPVRTALAAVLGDDLPSATLAGLQRCARELPDGATLPYVGVDPADPARPVRLCVRGLGPRLTAYLRDARWPGEADALRQHVLAPLEALQGGPEATRPLLHLDVAHALAPRLGLEYAFSRECQLEGRLAETDLLELLERQGWCAPGVTRGLRQWPGQTVELLSHQIWHSRVARRLNHVKVTWASGEAVGVKAYLCVAHELLADGTFVGGRPRHFGALPVRPTRGGTRVAGAPATIAMGRPRPERQEPPAVEVFRLGTHAAYRLRRGGRDMTMTVKEQQILETVLQRSVVDYEFRQQLLHDPRRAIHEALGVVVPANFRVKFIEKDKNVDALVVLPNFQCAPGELTEDELETVAGGGGGRPPVDPDWGDLP